MGEEVMLCSIGPFLGMTMGSDFLGESDTASQAFDESDSSLVSSLMSNVPNGGSGIINNCSESMKSKVEMNGRKIMQGCPEEPKALSIPA